MHGLLTHLALLRVVGANRSDDGSVIVPQPQMVVWTVLEVLPANVPVALMLVQPAPVRCQPRLAVVPPVRPHLLVSITSKYRDIC